MINMILRRHHSVRDQDEGGAVKTHARLSIKKTKRR